MTLRVVQPSDVYTVDHIIGTIYGPPGGLKTSLGFTSEAPILLDFDEGVHRAAFRRAFVPVPKWDEIADIQASDLAGYKTVVVDTAGRALDKLSADIIRRNPKMGQSSGALTLQGFGQLKVEFPAFLRKLKGFGLDILLVLHSEESKSGDDMITRIDAQGASKQEIYKVSDFMGAVSIERDGTIVVNMNPTDTAFGKNPGQLPPLKVKTINASSRYLADIFSRQKEKINTLTEEQRQVSAALEEWRGRVIDAPDAKGLTALIQEIVRLDPRVQDNAKRVLLSGARDRGFLYDKEAAEFRPQKPVQDAQMAPEAPAQAQGAPDAPAAAVEAQAALPVAPEEPQEEPPAETAATPVKAKLKLAAFWTERYADEGQRREAFRKIDARIFFKGKTKGARASVEELSDIDAAIMLHELESGQVQA